MIMLAPRILIAIVMVMTLAVWFSATAVVPTLRVEWEISAGAAVWLTASVQLGFVVGAVSSALLNLSDRISPMLLIFASSLGAALCTAALALFVSGIWVAIPLRFLTGICMAGIYPVGMKLTVSWSPRARRGASLGLFLGALTVGSALPNLIGVLDIDWRLLLLTAAAVTAAGGVLCLARVRVGPHTPATAASPRPAFAVQMFRDARQRAINIAYFGHMWELYAMWAWLATFLIAGGRIGTSPNAGALGAIVFIAIGVAGFLGCLLGGWASDRIGRSATAMAALVVSGLCCLLSPVAYLLPTPALVAFCLVWGASIIADSGVFSTLLSEETDHRYVGTALTAQTAIGFLITVITIQFVPIAAQAIGWQFAFLLLVPGPIVGVISLARFQHHRPRGGSHVHTPAADFRHR